jgi:hypothetical protein
MSKQATAAIEAVETETVAPAVGYAIPHRILVTSGDEGNFGKSTLIRHLLRPALMPYFADGVRFLAVEEEGRLSAGEDAKFKSTEVTSVINELEMIADDGEAVIVEIGAQRFERFMTELSRVKSNRFAFDKVVVPLGQAFKTEETFKSLLKIISQGINPRDVYIVFNQVELMAIAEGTFAEAQRTHYKSFLDAVRELGINVCPTPVMKSDIFEVLRKKEGDEFTVVGLSNLPENHYTLLAKAARKEGNEAAKLENLAMSALQMQAGAMSNDFCNIFTFIFPELPLD